MAVGTQSGKCTLTMCGEQWLFDLVLLVYYRVELDIDEGLMKIFKDGTLQSICSTMPRGQMFYPIVALDYGEDSIIVGS